MRCLALFVCAAVSTASWADVHYFVNVDPAGKKLDVKFEFETKGASTSIAMPNWAPGSYRLSEGGGKIKSLVVKDQTGHEVVLEHPDPATWSFSNKGITKVQATYSLDQTFNGEGVHYSGPSTYMYLVGRTQEKCQLVIGAPPAWNTYCGLEYVGRSLIMQARSYDELADNPVSCGKFVTDTYVSMGTPHTIVYHTGDASKVDRKKVVEACKFVSDSEGDFFGGHPFKKYVFHFTVMDSADGGWGLEHLASTQIGLASGVGDHTKTVIAHEYFHAWNVKRIRSAVLGPFDYTKLPKTGALWWLEGVTDYYASLLTHRYGMFDEAFFFTEIESNIQRTRAAQARMEVSPYDSSFRVGEASNGRGNSQGYRISYYNTGWVLGLCLDIELRSRTNGKKSLDDVEHLLWNQCKDNKPGFPEDGIRAALIKVGGVGMGDIYDKWVMKPGELPVEEQLAKVGLTFGKTSVSFKDPGFDAFGGQRGLRVGRLRTGDSIKEGDVILGVNGQSFEGMSGQQANAAFRKALDATLFGGKLSLVLKRGEESVNAEVPVSEGKRDVFKVSHSASGPDTDRLREGWYTAGKTKLSSSR
ncbi:MAG: M61 family metallopeptidase [Armatimonadetes bacterium]|nr:M61 family metallopeptidase [Armatimonadota bacterium]